MFVQQKTLGEDGQTGKGPVPLNMDTKGRDNLQASQLFYGPARAVGH
jgi:hypothetical protein